MRNLILVCLFAYLAGSVNFAVIFFKLAGKADPRVGFSGNAGTTNVYRQAGIFWAAFIFLLDIGRAVGVAVLSVYWLPASFVPWAGFFLVLGNAYPCFHGFNGGKGVANYLGFSLFVAPWWAVASAIMWLAAYGICRIPFVASFFMVFILAAGQIIFLNRESAATVGAAATFVLIIFNHRKNISELIKKRKQKNI